MNDFEFGTPGWVRTSDLRLRSPLLYPAELPGHANYYTSVRIERMMNGEFIKDRWIVAMLRDIARSRGIGFRSWSGDWIVELRKDDQVRRVIGYRFGLNDSAAANISQDKVATYTILAAHGIPAVRHELVRTKVSPANRQAFSDWQTIILKPLVGTSGHGISKFATVDEAVRYVEHSAIQAWAAAPYIDIESETRIVLLDGECLLSYKKESVAINGLKMFNLGLGARAVDIVPGDALLQLARDAQSTLGLRLCAVDIITVADGTQQVLEVNDAIMVENYARQSDANRQRAVAVYDKIVDRLFTS